MEKNGVSDARIYILLFIISFSGNALYWFAYFPGGLNLDAYGQWMQINGDLPFNNWHPFFLTIIYWVLTRIIDSFAFCIFVQIFLFSVSLSYFIYKIYKHYPQKRNIIFITLVISFNPAICLNNISLIKDVYFTIEVIWSLVILLDIYYMEYKSNSFSPIIKIFLISSIIILTRHNGFLYVIPFVVLTCIVLKNYKMIIGMLIAIIVFVIAIEGPVYKIIGVEPHDNPEGEMIGVPMSIMANALITDEENVPDDVKQYLLSIAEYDFWKDHYIIGEWDSIKWDIDETKIFEEVGVVDIFFMASKTIINCPDAALNSFVENTRVIWQVFGRAGWSSDVYIYIEKNPYDIKYSGNTKLNRVLDDVLKICETSIGSTIIWNLGGFVILILILFFRGIKKNPKLLIFTLPILIYVFGTMFLLCGPSYRYFYILPVITFPLFLIHIKELDEQQDQNSMERTN